MGEIVDTLSMNLAKKRAELERKKNLFASVPPGATFGELLDLEHEVAGLDRLIEDGRND
jgi:hypothetical protein